jgi:hypothetical protein
MRVFGLVVLSLLLALAAFALSEPALALEWPDGWDDSRLAEGVGSSAHPRISEGKLVWVRPVGDRGGELVLHDLATGESEVLAGTAPKAREPEIGGRRIAYMAGNGVALYDLDRGEVSSLASGPGFRFDLSLHGDLVLWRQTSRVGVEGPDFEDTSLLLYDLRTRETTTLAAGGAGSYVATSGWVVYNSYRRSQTMVRPEAAVWVYEVSTGETRELQTLRGAEAVALAGDRLVVRKPIPSFNGGAGELWSYDLRTGQARLIDDRSSGHQSVQADGDRVVWAAYDGGSAYAAIWDARTGEGTRVRTPQYHMGGLVLSGDLLIWHAQGQGRFGGTTWNYLFAYDLATGTLTRLAPHFGNNDGYTTDGARVIMTSGNAWPYRWDAPLELLLFERAPAVREGFADLGGTHPYGTAIRALKERGIVQGYELRSGGFVFRPDERITRAQFAKMLALALELPLVEGAVPPFDDIAGTGLFPGAYVAALARRGIITGTGPRRFSPYGQLTRAQLMTLTVRGAERLLPGVLSARLPSAFADYRGVVGRFDPTHGPSLFRGEVNGLVDGLLGYGGAWNPWQPGTRGEAAQVLWNLLAKDGRPAPGA